MTSTKVKGCAPIAPPSGVKKRTRKEKKPVTSTKQYEKDQPSKTNKLNLTIIKEYIQNLAFYLCYKK